MVLLEGREQKVCLTNTVDITDRQADERQTDTTDDTPHRIKIQRLDRKTRTVSTSLSMRTPWAAQSARFPWLGATKPSIVLRGIWWEQRKTMTSSAQHKYPPPPKKKNKIEPCEG